MPSSADASKILGINYYDNQICYVIKSIGTWTWTLCWTLACTTFCPLRYVNQYCPLLFSGGWRKLTDASIIVGLTKQSTKNYNTARQKTTTIKTYDNFSTKTNLDRGICNSFIKLWLISPLKWYIGSRHTHSKMLFWKCDINMRQ